MTDGRTGLETHELEPRHDARVVKEMLARKLFGLVVELKVVHADGALYVLVKSRLVDVDERQRLELRVGGGRRSAMVVSQLIEQLHKQRQRERNKINQNEYEMLSFGRRQSTVVMMMAPCSFRKPSSSSRKLT